MRKRLFIGLSVVGYLGFGLCLIPISSNTSEIAAYSEATSNSAAWVNTNSNEIVLQAAETVINSPKTVIYANESVSVPEQSETVQESTTEFVPYDIPLDDELQEYAYDLCIEDGISFEIVMALIEHESSYRADVISKTNDYGLMQINRCNHEWLREELGVQDFCDPRENIKSGIFILQDISKRYQDIYMGLMVYNMGETKAKKLWKQGIYSSKYARAIVSRAEELESQRR